MLDKCFWCMKHYNYHCKCIAFLSCAFQRYCIPVYILSRSFSLSRKFITHKHVDITKHLFMLFSLPLSVCVCVCICIRAFFRCIRLTHNCGLSTRCSYTDGVLYECCSFLQRRCCPIHTKTFPKHCVRMYGCVLPVCMFWIHLFQFVVRLLTRSQAACVWVCVLCVWTICICHAHSPFLGGYLPLFSESQKAAFQFTAYPLHSTHTFAKELQSINSSKIKMNVLGLNFRNEMHHTHKHNLPCCTLRTRSQINADLFSLPL